MGYFQNRGWDKVDAKTAALNAAKAHREAEKLIGAPADKMIRLPNDPNDAEAMRQVRQKLGMPQDAKGYDFSSIKRADGSELPQADRDMWAQRALDLGLKPADAIKLVSETVKSEDALRSSESTEAAGKLAMEKTELAKNWGANYEANMFIARQAAAKLNIAPEAIVALEKAVGYSKVMEMFRDLGTKIGEDRFVSNPGPGGTGVMTREQAVAKKAELMRDTQWTKSYMDGDRAKAAEMTALNTIIVSQ